jgi:hypothetical protein
MTQNFVRYGADIERDDPGFEQGLEKVLETMRHNMTVSVEGEGIGRAVREAHAKGYGLARGEVEILKDLPKEYAQAFTPSPEFMRRWRASRTASAMPGRTGICRPVAVSG